MFGFFAFNGGSKFTIAGEGDGLAVARAVVNTMLAGSAGGITSILLHRIMSASRRNCVSLDIVSAHVDLYDCSNRSCIFIPDWYGNGSILNLLSKNMVSQ